MLKRLVVVYGLFLVAIVFLADSGWAAWLFSGMAAIPFSDKLGHFLLMGTMSFLLTLVSHADHKKVAGIPSLQAPFWLAVVVTLEEFSQIWLPNRGVSLLALAFDYLGIVLFGFLAFGLKNRRRFHHS